MDLGGLYRIQEWNRVCGCLPVYGNCINIKSVIIKTFYRAQSVKLNIVGGGLTGRNLEWNWQNTEDLEQMAMVQINIFIYLQLSTNVDLSFKKRSIIHKGHYDCDHSAEDSDLGTMSQVDMDIPKYLSRIGFSGPTEP